MKEIPLSHHPNDWIFLILHQNWANYENLWLSWCNLTKRMYMHFCRYSCHLVWTVYTSVDCVLWFFLPVWESAFSAGSSTSRILIDIGRNPGGCAWMFWNFHVVLLLLLLATYGTCKVTIKGQYFLCFHHTVDTPSILEKSAELLMRSSIHTKFLSRGLRKLVSQH